MATKDRRTITQEPGQPRFKLPDPERLHASYDAKYDTLFVSVEPPVPAVSYKVDDAWVRVVRETVEVVGYELEDFERAFLPKHPGIASIWKQARAHRRGLFSKRSRGDLDGLTASTLDWVRACLGEASTPTAPNTW